MSNEYPPKRSAAGKLLGEIQDNAALKVGRSPVSGMKKVVAGAAKVNKALGSGKSKVGKIAKKLGF